MSQSLEDRILEMRNKRGYTYRQIAEELRIAYGTVANTLAPQDDYLRLKKKLNDLWIIRKENTDEQEASST